MRSRNPIIVLCAYFFSVRSLFRSVVSVDTHVMNGLMYPCECLFSSMHIFTSQKLFISHSMISFSLCRIEKKFNANWERERMQNDRERECREKKKSRECNLICKTDVYQIVWLVKCALWCIYLNSTCLKMSWLAGWLHIIPPHSLKCCRVPICIFLRMVNGVRVWFLWLFCIWNFKNSLAQFLIL